MRKGKLTKQQRVVLAMAAAGLSNDEIAKNLMLSKRTVDAHMRNGMEALGVNTRTAAVVLAFHYGEIDLQSVANNILASGDGLATG